MTVLARRLARAVGTDHSATVDLEAHLAEVARTVVRARNSSPSRLPHRRPLTLLAPKRTRTKKQVAA